MSEPIRRRAMYRTGWGPMEPSEELATAIGIARERMSGLVETWAIRGPLDSQDLRNLVVSAYLQGVYDIAATREEPVVGTGF